MPVTEDSFIKIPINIATVPRTGHVIVDKYWLCLDDKYILFYENIDHPQHNRHPSVIEYIIEKDKIFNSYKLSCKKIGTVFIESCKRLQKVEQKLKK